MLALFVLCSLPALAAQGGEGPYLFDVLKKPTYLAAWKGILAGESVPDWVSHYAKIFDAPATRRRAWRWAAKPTGSLGCARPMIVVTTSLMSCFCREANAGLLSDRGKESWLG